MSEDIAVGLCVCLKTSLWAFYAVLAWTRWGGQFHTPCRPWHWLVHDYRLPAKTQSDLWQRRACNVQVQYVLWFHCLFFECLHIASAGKYRGSGRSHSLYFCFLHWNGSWPCSPLVAWGPVFMQWNGMKTVRILKCLNGWEIRLKGVKGESPHCVLVSSIRRNCQVRII